jgi:hypothetical protein
MGNKKNQKKRYIAPKIELAYIVQLETGIAASSATITPGETTNTPVVTDWEEKKNEQNWNF